jgi:hypothetical protein
VTKDSGLDRFWNFKLKERRRGIVKCAAGKARKKSIYGSGDTSLVGPLGKSKSNRAYKASKTLVSGAGMVVAVGV